MKQMKKKGENCGLSCITDTMCTTKGKSHLKVCSTFVCGGVFSVVAFHGESNTKDVFAPSKNVLVL